MSNPADNAAIEEIYRIFVNAIFAHKAYSNTFHLHLLPLEQLLQSVKKSGFTVYLTSSSYMAEEPRDAFFNLVRKMLNIAFVSHLLGDFVGNVSVLLLSRWEFLLLIVELYR